MNKKEIAERALKTFVEAFFPVFISALAAADRLDFSELKAVLVSALISASAAGLSALWNTTAGILKRKEEALEEGTFG